jgi:GH15 family glucan-1,4-alpha-glucosidase
VVAVTRRYRPGTLVLETVFATAEGEVALIDFMPPRSGVSDLVRLVVGKSGRVAMRTELVLRLDYGSTVPWATRLADGALRFIAGPDMTVLRTPVALHGECLTTRGAFTMDAGETVPFTLSYAPSHHLPPGALDGPAALPDTEAYWRDWVGRGTTAGPWAEAIERSLITLKALTYQPTGGIVAAATTSLPECLGARATGTTGSAGCGTPPSPCSPLWTAATATRRALGATGSCAPSPAVPSRCNHVWAGRGTLPAGARAALAARL